MEIERSFADVEKRTTSKYKTEKQANFSIRQIDCNEQGNSYKIKLSSVYICVVKSAYATWELE